MTVYNLINPENYKLNNLEGNQVLPAQPIKPRTTPAAAPIDRDRYNNARIPSHDEDGAGPARATLRDMRGRAPASTITPRRRGRAASRGGGGRASTQRTATQDPAARSNSPITRTNIIELFNNLQKSQLARASLTPAPKYNPPQRTPAPSPSIPPQLPPQPHQGWPQLPSNQYNQPPTHTNSGQPGYKPPTTTKQPMPRQQQLIQQLVPSQHLIASQQQQPYSGPPPSNQTQGEG